MHRALNEMNLTPDLILVDGNSFTAYYDDDNELVDYKCVIGGDNEYFNIACASILAKEYHDKIIKDMYRKSLKMIDMTDTMCYGTTNRDGISEWGVSKYHRRTFGICQGKDIAPID